MRSTKIQIGVIKRGFKNEAVVKTERSKRWYANRRSKHTRFGVRLWRSCLPIECRGVAADAQQPENKGGAIAGEEGEKSQQPEEGGMRFGSVVLELQQRGRFRMKQAATSAALALTGDTTAQVSKRWVKTKALQNQHPADSHESLAKELGSELEEMDSH
ncbi:hypothetical protein L2E82_41769 [Cichorium intybus]|uniref:Uncharacterized protein n=1 Tax=Cichorium intybus TaxID=13427 RepID=A0ACB8ZKG1_CICIN|nr:hypothetical protein L2E82_41769 [Cichorium intybus]